MTFLLGQVSPDFYHVHGTEYLLPSTLVNGNPPLPSGPMTAAAVVVAAVLVLVVVLLERRLPWHRMSRFHRVLLRVLIVLNFFAFWEGGLQLCASRFNEPTFLPDPATFWKINPQLTEEWTKSHDRPPTGALRGEREAPAQPAIERPKAPGAYRALFFGESQLVSINRIEIDIPKSYPTVLQSLLEAAAPGRVFEMINDGVPGFSSWQGLLLLRQQLASKPDLVVFAFGYHDSSPAYAQDRDVLTDQPWLHAMRSVLYRSELYLLIRKYVIVARESAEEKHMRQRGGLPTFRVPLAQFEENLRTLAEMGRANGFQVAFMLQPVRRDCSRLVGLNSVQLYQDAMRRVGAEQNVLVLDVRGPMEKLAPDEYARCWDDFIHMTSLGHEHVARILFEQLSKSSLQPFQGLKTPSPAPSPSAP